MKTTNMKKSFLLFFKSAAVTAAVIMLISALFIGIITADTTINKTVGVKSGNSIDYQPDTKILSLSLLGKELTLDMSIVSDFTDKAKSFEFIVAPEFRLGKTAVLYIKNLLWSLFT